jgi:hypothetical protein
MTDTCFTQTKGYSKCFTKYKGCEKECSSNLPGIVGYLFDYFKDDRIAVSKYCLFYKYIIIPLNDVDTEDINKEEFDYIMEGFDKMISSERNDINKGIKEPLLYTFLGTEVLQRFKRLRDVLFTKYDIYIRDILDMLKSKCAINPCTQSYIDIVLWKIYNIEMLENILGNKDKKGILSLIRVISSRNRSLKPIVEINESNFNWFLDTIEANSDTNVDKAREDGYILTIADTKNFKLLWGIFNGIMFKKLTKVASSLNAESLCIDKFKRENNPNIKIYNEVNKNVVKDYYTKF